MENTENNRLIAEFMAFQTRTDAVDDRVLAYYVGDVIKNADNSKNENEENVFHPEDMQFDTDWNWLMEVVGKIESIVWEELNDTSFNVTIGATSYCVIQDNNGDILEIIGQGTTKIESVYKAVIEFINWYNEN